MEVWLSLTRWRRKPRARLRSRKVVERDEIDLTIACVSALCSSARIRGATGAVEALARQNRLRRRLLVVN